MLEFIIGGAAEGGEIPRLFSLDGGYIEGPVDHLPEGADMND